MKKLKYEVKISLVEEAGVDPETKKMLYETKQVLGHEESFGSTDILMNLEMRRMTGYTIENIFDKILQKAIKEAAEVCDDLLGV